MKASFRPAIFAASLLASLGTLRAEIQACNFASGVVWAGGDSGELVYAKGNEPAQVVWKDGKGISAATTAGHRLVLSGEGKLFVFTPGSWTPGVTDTKEGWVTALGGSADTALAIDAGGNVLKLEKDGSWTRWPKVIKGRVENLAFFRGQWVAVGWSESPTEPTADADNEDGPAMVNAPHWIRSRLERKIWWSADGAVWQAVEVPFGEMASPYGMVMSVAGGPAGWLAVGTEGGAWFSADGKVWKPVEVPGPEWEQYGDTRVQCIGGAFWITVSEGGARPDSIHRSTDGQTWALVPLVAGARRDGLFIREGKTYAIGVRKEGRGLEIAPVEDFSVVPSPNAAELAALKAAEDKVLAEKKAAEAKALAEQQAREKKRQAIAANLTDLSGVFHGTANGIAWEGDQLVVSAAGGIYRSADGAKFELWIPYDHVAFLGLREVGGRLWTWSGSPSEARSYLSGFPLNSGGKLPVYQTAAGRITGLAGEEGKLALITEGGRWSGVYTMDDPAKGWSFKVTEITGLLPMKLSSLPGSIGPDLAYGNGRWVAIGRRADDTTVAAVSTDRVDWRLVPVGAPPGGMMRIVFANGRFVASGHQAFSEDIPWTIASSTDGENWQLATLPGERPGLVDVAGGRLYAHNRTGLFTSDDARTWRYLADHSPLDAVTLQEIGGRIVLVGEPVSGAKPFQLVSLPAPSAAALAAAPEATTRKVVAALAKFDAAALSADSPGQLGKPAATLVKEMDQLMPGKLADAIFAAAKHVLFHVGGAEGYYAFMMGVPDGPRLKEASAQLKSASQPQKVLIKALANQQLNRSTGGQVQGVDTRSWPAKTVPARQPKKSDDWDITAVRAALASGADGAAADLMLCYAEGQGVPVDPVLSVFWSSVFEVLIPEPQTQDEEKANQVLAAAGSAYARAWIAWRLDGQDTVKHQKEIIGLLTMARAGGYLPADRKLAEVKRAGQGSATPADWFAAATAVSSMQAQAEADRLRQGQPRNAQPTAQEIAAQAREAANMMRDAVTQSGREVEPGRAAADMANVRSIGLLGAMVRLLDLERDKELNAAELAQLKKFWAAAAVGQIDRSTLDKEIGAQNFLSEKVTGFFDDPAVAAQVLAAHRRLTGLPAVPPDLPVQISRLEEWLAGFARKERQAGNLLVMPAIYRAAAERVFFDRYLPLLQLPIGVRPYGNPSLASQLQESAYLMEDFNGADWEGGNGPPLALPASLLGPDSAPFYTSWNHWPALKKAAGAGNVPDVIFYVNQLVIALRIELAARQPEIDQPPAKEFSDLLADPVRS
jgi:hypothetical protein